MTNTALNTTATSPIGIREALQRGFTHSLSGFDSEHRVTMGVVLGMMAGLVPNDSLLAYVIIGVMILSLSNLLSGILSLVLFSGISPLLDRWSDPLGQTVLTQPALQGLFRTMMEMPLLPWLRFDNTVVMGQFLISLALVYPIYGISYRVYARIKPWLLGWFATKRSTRWLVPRYGDDRTQSATAATAAAAVE